MTLLFILGFFLLSCGVIYFAPRLILWSGVLLLYMLVSYNLLYDYMYVSVWYLFAIIYLVITLFFNFKPLRRILSNGIYMKAKRLLPKISETEGLALNAGGCWYEQEVFCGKPDFNKLHNSKKFALSNEEQDFLANETNQLCKMVDDWQVNHFERDLPVTVWNFIREKGFFGLVIAKEYGGKGFSAAAHSEIVMKLATRSTTLAVTVMVPNSLGPGELLQAYGTTEQKQYYLPRLSKGEEIPCFALTSPTAGSDATSIIDEGIVCQAEFQGKSVLGIRLKNVDKRYITLAPIATLVGLAFKLYDPDGLLGAIGRPGITCALLPHDHPGVEIGNRLLPLNLSFMNGTIRIKDAFIPIDWIIGGQAMAGEGWRMLVECLSIGRSISLPACGTANALLSVVTSSAYAGIREQFHVAIGNFEGVEDVLAKMGGLTYMMNAVRQYTVSAVDNGIKPSVASAIAKYHLTEMGRTVINDAMDIHGGRGIIMGPNNYLASVYQGLPVGITVEGANIMSRNLLIFGQGVMKCHPYLQKEYEALASNDGRKDFDKVMFAHIGYFARNKTRAIFHAFTGGIFSRGYNSKFKYFYKDIARLSSSFAYVSDIVLFILGGELKRRERISARLGDIMSYLYMACATLKYFKDNGEIESDEIFVTWVLEHCLFAAQNALLAVLHNFPLKSIGKFLEILLFPYGKPFKGPSDKLEHMLSQSLLHDSPTRRAFKQMCFVADDPTDIVGRMEIAFQAVLKVNPIKAKITDAVHAKQLVRASYDKMAVAANSMNIISNDELISLNKAAEYSHEVIQVDEFPPYEIGPKNAHPEWQMK